MWIVDIGEMSLVVAAVVVVVAAAVVAAAVVAAVAAVVVVVVAVVVAAVVLITKAGHVAGWGGGCTNMRVRNQPGGARGVRRMG